MYNSLGQVPNKNLDRADGEQRRLYQPAINIKTRSSYLFLTVFTVIQNLPKLLGVVKMLVMFISSVLLCYACRLS